MNVLRGTGTSGLVALVILALGGSDLKNSLTLSNFQLKNRTVPDDVILAIAARTVDGLVRIVD